MKIGDRDLDGRVLVVAEIGNNHEGDMEVARRLVEEAAAAGADAVKFQTFRADRFASPQDSERFRRLQSFELPPEAFAALADIAHEHGLLFLSTPLDLESADVLEPLVDAFKIASGDIDFFPLLARVAATGKSVVLSTGQSELDEVARAVAFVRERRDAGEDGIAVLHCVSSYPVPEDETHLRAIQALQAELPSCTIGYSDHTVGLDAAPLAVALGARIVEKHFTLAHDFSAFRDHALSAEPAELQELVRRIRAAEALLGEARKRVQPSEASARTAIRRSVAAGRDLPRGHRLTSEDLIWTRPADSLRPGEEAALLGRELQRDVSLGEHLRPDDVS